MPDYIAKPLFAILFWAAIYLIPIMGRRSGKLAWAVVWLRFKNFIPVSVGLALIATTLGGMISGTVGAIGSLVASLLSTIWLFLTYVIFRPQD